MAASFTRLRTRKTRMAQELAAQVRQLLLTFPDTPQNVVDEISKVIDRLTPSSDRETFVQLSPHQNALVVEYLSQYSTRKVVAVRIWAQCFRYLRLDTQEIVASREELAASIGTSVVNVSRVMTELENFGAIIKRRDQEAKTNGSARVTYYMNPMVGTMLSGVVRDKARADAPRLGSKKPRLRIVAS